jgi:hypothetical protein
MHKHISRERHLNRKALLGVDPGFIGLPRRDAKYADGLGNLLLDCAVQ